MTTKFRAVVSTVAIWSSAWSVLGALFRIGSPNEAGVVLAPSMVFAAALGALVPGAIGGLVFSGVLRASRRRRWVDFSFNEFAVYGAIGGTLVPLVDLIALGGSRSFAVVAPTLAQCLVGGVVCSVTSLYLARRVCSTTIIA